MVQMRRIVGLSVLMLALSIVAVLFTWSIPEDSPTPRALLAADGTPGRPTEEPLHLSALDGDNITRAFGFTADGHPYIVLKVPPERLADAVLQGFHIPPTTDHPRESMTLIAYDAKSTYLGCPVDYMPSLHGPGLWLMDVCHQGQFNALDSGAARPSTPNHGPLTPMKVTLSADADPIIRVQTA